MHRTLKVLAVATLVATTAGVAQAQGGLGFGVHAGVALPTGDFGDGASTGFQVGGELGFNPASLPVGIRIDVDFNRFGLEQGVNGNARIISGVANALFKVPATAISPYLVGGLGMYNGKVTLNDVDVPEAENSETKFGFQLGGGLGFNLSGFETAVEAKFVNILTEGSATRFLPVTFRIMFGGAGSGSGGTTGR